MLYVCVYVIQFSSLPPPALFFFRCPHTTSLQSFQVLIAAITVIIIIICRCLEKGGVTPQPATTTANSNRCAAFETRKDCNAAKADAVNLGFSCVFRAGSSNPSENGCLEKEVESAVENRCAEFGNRKKCNAAKADFANLGFKCVFRKETGCIEK